MKKLALIVFAGVVAGVSSMAIEPELKGTPTELGEYLNKLPERVAISGAAERRVESDRAVVEVRVTTSSRKLKDALENNSKIRTDIAAKLTAGGIDKARIHTSRFSSTPVHSSWSGKVKEYFIISTVRVYAESENEIGLLAGLVDSSEQIELVSLTFEMTKKDDIIADLMKESFEKVEKQKKLYESSLGVRLVPRRIIVPSKDGRNFNMRFRRGNRALSDSFASTMTNPDYDVVLHALAAREPEPENFEERLFKAAVVVLFDVYPQEKQ